MIGEKTTGVFGSVGATFLGPSEPWEKALPSAVFDAIDFSQNPINPISDKKTQELQLTLIFSHIILYGSSSLNNLITSVKQNLISF